MMSIYCIAIVGIIYLNKLALDNCDIGDGYNAILIGDSHTMWAIDDSKLEGVRNISLNAEGYRYSYLKLKQLFEKEQGIEQVYIGFGYHNLSGYFDDYITGPKFLNFFDRYLPVLMLEDYKQVILGSPKNAFSLVSKLGKRGWKSGLARQCRLYGDFPQEIKMDTYRADVMERRINDQFYTDDGLWGMSQSNYQSLVELIELCRELGIEPIMLNTPLHPEYVNQVPKKYREIYENFLVDYQLSSFAFEGLNLSDEHFLPDGDHTNYEGAMLSTEHFQEYLNAK